MSEPVIILEPGEERAQHIARALSSKTAGSILSILSESPKPLSSISDQLDIPLPKVKYHVDNLLDAGILEITEERYSVKGRRVKFYGLKHQVLVVAPKMVNLKAMLLKYSSVFGVFLLLAFFLLLILYHVPIPEAPPLLGGGSLDPDTVPTMPFAAGETILREAPNFLLFFAGGGVTTVFALIIEWYVNRNGLQ